MDWADLLRALGLAAAIEGALYALFPEGTRNAMLSFMTMPTGTRQVIGVGLCALGVILVMVAGADLR